MSIQLVMGNQSGDMDSICSAIGLSLILPNALPILNIEKSEMAIRKDVLYLFDLLSIDPDELYYRDALPFFFTLAKEGKALMALVDHNVLAPDQQEWVPYVNWIIDHHVDEGVEYPRLEKKVIAQVGSCATLIAEMKDLGLILQAPILLDSVTKVTVRDRKFMQGGEALLQTLLQKKRDLSSLTPFQLLTRDFKTYQKGQCLYGISSLPHGAVVDDGAANALMKDKGLEFLVVLEWRGEDKFVRAFNAPWIFSRLKELFAGEGRLKEPLSRKVFQPILHSRII